MIGIGTDLVEVQRFRDALRRTPSLAGRLFTADERAHASARKDPAERLAARFAAKEAALKALGLGLGAARFRDIEVVRAPSGAPSLSLHGSAARLATDRGVVRWEVSLTHTATMAQAVVAAFGEVGG